MKNALDFYGRPKFVRRTGAEDEDLNSEIFSNFSLYQSHYHSSTEAHLGLDVSSSGELQVTAGPDFVERHQERFVLSRVGRRCNQGKQLCDGIFCERNLGSDARRLLQGEFHSFGSHTQLRVRLWCQPQDHC